MLGEGRESHRFYYLVVEYVEELDHDRCIEGSMKVCHDPLATHVEKLYKGNDRMFIHDENQRVKNNFLSSHFTLFPSIKQERRAYKCIHLLCLRYFPLSFFR